ncbi:MAG: hypothetical protein ACE5GA_09855 [Candidatus Zixiibacteriota bacterium]
MRVTSGEKTRNGTPGMWMLSYNRPSSRHYFTLEDIGQACLRFNHYARAALRQTVETLHSAGTSCAETPDTKNPPPK